MFGLEFTSKFPFIQKTKISYLKFEIGDNNELRDFQILIKKYRTLLLENQVPINKIRFVAQPTFMYDIDKDVINPKYHVMLPIDKKTGVMNANYPIIEINKPEKIITISVNTYKYKDNYKLLKEKLKGTKKGIVIYYIDYDTIRFSILDEEVEKYNLS